MCNKRKIQGASTVSNMVVMLEEAHWLKLPTLVRLHGNHLHDLFYDKRSW